MPDQNYFMDVVYSGGTYTFPITPKYFPKLSFNWKRSGHEVAVVDTVPVHGWYSEADQDATNLAWNTLRGIAHNGTFVTLRFRKQDGTLIGILTNATIEDLQSVDSDGGHTNHVEFEFTAREERGVRFPGLVNVEHEDEEIKEVDENGRVTKKFRRRVLATGVRGNTNNARTFVEGLKPPLQKMTRESIRTVNYDGDVEGVWEFDDTASYVGDWRYWREEVVYLPGIRSNQFYRTSGIPILIEGGFGPSRLRVTGHMERHDESFPTPEELIAHFKGQVNAATEVVFESEPEIGGIYVVEWSADIPDEPTVWGMDYSYTLVFGEANPKPSEAPRPRNQWSG